MALWLYRKPDESDDALLAAISAAAGIPPGQTAYVAVAFDLHHDGHVLLKAFANTTEPAQIAHILAATLDQLQEGLARQN